MIYDDVNGLNVGQTARPLFSYQARQATPVDATTGSYSGLDPAIADIYLQNGTSSVGDWPAVIPVGLGVRRVEARNADNTIYGFNSDADAIWPSGATTLTSTRKSLTVLTSIDAPLSTIISNFSPSSGCNGDVVTISGANFTGATNVSFNGTSAITFTVDNDGQITATVPAGATTGTISVTTPGCTAASNASFTLVCGVTFTSNIQLEGYYIGGGTMQGVLLNEVVTGATGVEVDTLLIEAYADPLTYIPLNGQKGVLKTNGDVTVDFVNPVLPGNSYWIRIKQRNHVETWSAAPVLVSSSTTYLFSSAATQAFVGNQKDNGDGFFSFYCGDINQDGAIDALDYVDLDPSIQNGDGGYAVGDLNGDGAVDALDYLILDPNIQAGVGTAIP